MDFPPERKLYARDFLRLTKLVMGPVQSIIKAHIKNGVSLEVLRKAFAAFKQGTTTCWSPLAREDAKFLYERLPRGFRKAATPRPGMGAWSYEQWREATKIYIKRESQELEKKANLPGHSTPATIKWGLILPSYGQQLSMQSPQPSQAMTPTMPPPKPRTPGGSRGAASLLPPSTPPTTTQDLDPLFTSKCHVATNRLESSSSSMEKKKKRKEKKNSSSPVNESTPRRLHHQPYMGILPMDVEYDKGGVGGGGRPSTSRVGEEETMGLLTAEALGRVCPTPPTPPPAAWKSWELPPAAGRMGRKAQALSTSSISSIVSSHLANCDGAVERKRKAQEVFDEIDRRVKQKKRDIELLNKQLKEQARELEEMKDERREAKNLVKTEDGNIIAGYEMLRTAVQEEKEQLELEEA